MFYLLKTILVKILSAAFILTILIPTISAQKADQLPIPPLLYRFCSIYPTADYNFEFASDNAWNLFVPYQNGNLISINGQTLQKLWETNLGGDIVSKTLTIGSKIFIVTHSKPRQSIEPDLEFEKNQNQTAKFILHSLDKLSGIAEWQIELDGSGQTFLHSYTNDIIVLAGSGETYSVSKFNGKVNWQQKLKAEISAVPYTFANKILIGTQAKLVYTLSLDDGLITNQVILPEVATVVITNATGDAVITGDKKGNLRSVKMNGQVQNWHSRQGAEISAISKTRFGLLVASFDNFVYLFEEKKGNIIWKRRTAGRVVTMPGVTDDYFIAVSVNEPTATVINPFDGRILNRITLENGNFFSGTSIRLNKLLFFATRNGIVSFSTNSENSQGCQKTEKQPFEY